MVPAKGVERWLTQRLSHRLGAAPARRDGVCAGVRFTSPRSLVAAVLGLDRRRPVGRRRDGLAAAGGARRLPRRGVVRAAGPAPRPLRHRRRGRAPAGPAVRRRRALAGLFAAYAVQRPTLLADWRDGPRHRRPRRRPRRRPGLAGRAVAAARRAGRRPAAAPAARGHPDAAARRAGGVRPARRGSRCSGTPGCRSPRSSCSTRWPRAATYTSGCRTPAARSGRARRRAAGAVAARADDSHHQVAHPLLADARPRQPRAAAARWPRSRPTTSTPAMPAAPGHPARLAAGRPARQRTSLRRARADGRRPQRPGARLPRAARQVDVLREVLLGMLEDDPTLEPRDILVMCPDIETYAPLITAGFGLGDLGRRAATRPTGCGSGSPTGRCARPTRCSRRRARSLDLAGSRATASQVLDLAAGRAGPPPLRVHRRRPRHAHHAGSRESGVRWGLRPRAPRRVRPGRLPAEHLARRARPHPARRGDGRGRAARWLDNALPLDDVGSSDIDLAGRLAELVDRLRRSPTALDGDQPSATGWARSPTARAATDVRRDDAGSGQVRARARAGG